MYEKVFTYASARRARGIFYTILYIFVNFSTLSTCRQKEKESRNSPPLIVCNGSIIPLLR